MQAPFVVFPFGDVVGKVLWFGLGDSPDGGDVDEVGDPYGEVTDGPVRHELTGGFGRDWDGGLFWWFGELGCANCCAGTAWSVADCGWLGSSFAVSGTAWQASATAVIVTIARAVLMALCAGFCIGLSLRCCLVSIMAVALESWRPAF